MPGRKKWNPEHMKTAVEAVRNGEMGSFKAARIYNVPQTTLERYVKDEMKSSTDVVNTKLGRKQYLPSDLEKDLAEHCILLEERYFGLSQKDLRRLAFQLAEKNGIAHPFSKKSESAGRKWVKNFLRRNPQLAVRSPQGLSFARAKHFTLEAVAKFFDIYEPAMEKIKHQPHRIYNCDETGISIVQHKHTKVIGMKGKRQISALQAAERGCLVTVVTCFSAAGHYVPPLIIFPRKNMKLELMNGAPPASIYACHPSGWIQTELFTQWLRHFIEHVKPSAQDPVVLVLDGHSSHTRNLDVIMLGREHNLIIICLPPHATHKMQPLDLSFMSPFKTYYAQEIEQWIRQNGGRPVTIYQVSELLGKAYARAATVESAMNGFRKAGLYPCDRNVFREHDFPHSNTSELSVQQMPPLQPGTSKESDSTPTSPESVPLVRAADVSPVPSLPPKSGNSSSRSGSAQVITSSPYKQTIEESLRKKKEAEQKKVMNAQKRKQREKERAKEGTSRGKRPTSSSQGARSKRRLPFVTDPSDSDNDIVQLEDSDEDLSEDEEDAECLFCAGRFSEDNEGEDWIRCCKCFKWSHTLCAGSDDKVFICDLCK